MELKGSQTETNLMCAFAGESQARNRYTYYASIAKKEGCVQISDIFSETADQEKEHDKRYKDLAANLDANKVFERDQEVVWRCRNCGYLHKGKKALNKCPACDHPKAHFELLGENW